MNQNVTFDAVNSLAHRTHYCVWFFITSNNHFKLTASASGVIINTQKCVWRSLAVDLYDFLNFFLFVQKLKRRHGCLVCSPHELGARHEKSFANTALRGQVAGRCLAKAAHVECISELPMTSTHLRCLRYLLSRETYLDSVNWLALALFLKGGSGNHKLS